MLLVSFFAMTLNWFPASDTRSLSQAPWTALHHAVLPAMALAATGKDYPVVQSVMLAMVVIAIGINR